MRTALSLTFMLCLAVVLAACGNDSFVDEEKPEDVTVSLSQGDSIAFDCPASGLKGAGVYTKGLMTTGMAYAADGTPVYRLPLNEDHYLDRPRIERIRTATFEADSFFCRLRIESPGRFSLKAVECGMPQPVRFELTLDYELDSRTFVFFIEP